MVNTSAAERSVSLGRDLGGVLPIGIPLGWQPESPGRVRRFGVRRGGRCCHLDEEGQHLWAAAWVAPSRHELIDALSTDWKRDRSAVAADVNRFIGGSLLLQLDGDWPADWQRIGAVRVVPRAFVLDCDKAKGFRLISPDGRWEVWLSPAEYGLWTSFDGVVDLNAAVAAAEEATGFGEALLRQRAHSVLVAAVRLRAVFLDVGKT